MQESPTTHIDISTGAGAVRIPAYRVQSLVIGSGAAGLNAALQMHAQGMRDLCIVTEGLHLGTSINTGSDKQTYYKLALCARGDDSPRSMAEVYVAGGGMHGDVALVEAALSPRAFLNLVQLGVPFPRDRYGQFMGYKTDHDPRGRATSIGPYTSREMCRSLIAELKRRDVAIREERWVFSLVTATEAEGGQRAAGALAVGPDGAIEAYMAENVLYAAGGPGGLYKTSVYPEVHTGGIGVALMAGARARNLPESQYGMASTKFRWNVSGTYMQVIPSFISTDADGVSNPREFLREAYDDVGVMNSMVFLKGYQWPFDPRKVVNGSSLIDILVYIETVEKKRRVFLDFRRNPEGFSFDALNEEAREYLAKSNALLPTPIERLEHMNPGAIELYLDHDIDIRREPLEIAVCAQHNNGGLDANLWWESTNVAHLFPLGEINGSHGVYRPGGSALNAGQVAGFRAAEFIANRYADWSIEESACITAAGEAAAGAIEWLERCASAPASWQEERDELQARMSRAAAHIRSPALLETAVDEALAQWRRIESQGCRFSDASEKADAFRTRQLCFAHLAYLQAVLAAVRSGVGSRGSAIVLDPHGTPAHPGLGDAWRFQAENPDFRSQCLETTIAPDGTAESQWKPLRAVPEDEPWFETAWAAFRNGEIYRT